MPLRLLLPTACCLLPTLVIAQPIAWDTHPDTWVATDALGRSMPTPEQAGPPRPGKVVGIFYFLWLGQHGHTVYDISKLLAADPAAPKYGPPGAFHHWGKPLFDYYRSDDPFIQRKHVQMLSDAGVDVLFFDVTNAFTYGTVYLPFCKILDEFRTTGQRFPKIAFLCHSREHEVVARLYDTFYAKNLHPELWFRWQGTPLILCKPSAVPPAARDFFTVRESWAWSHPKGWFGDGRDKWPWIDNHPQNPGWHDRPGKPEQVSVKVAGHPTNNLGRSFHNGKQPPPGQLRTDSGPCFDEQWKRALEIDPQVVFVTGWNEWVAQRFTNGAAPRFLGKPIHKGDTFFVDQYNPEFSRDIEPMLGGHGDNYYYQLAAAVRRFKGARPLPPVSPRPIAVDGKFDDWKDVAPEFRDTLSDPVSRDHPAYDKAAPRLVNETGRNDLAAFKLSLDPAHLYFYARTRSPLVGRDAGNWMVLFLDADNDPRTGWLGYDLAINRAAPGSIERHAGPGYRWSEIGKTTLLSNNNELELALPRALLPRRPNTPAGTLPPAIDFKWADNLQHTGDWSDFTLHGDAAPNDRFNYRARFP